MGRWTNCMQRRDYVTTHDTMMPVDGPRELPASGVEEDVTLTYHAAKLKDLRRRLQFKVKHFNWITHAHSVAGCKRKYCTLLAISNKLNFNQCTVDKGTCEDLRVHKGVRCVLIHLRTQGTMLAHECRGKNFIRKINAIQMKMDKLAAVKNWEHIMLTYESSFSRNVSMVSLLCNSLDNSPTSTWRRICAHISEVDRQYLSSSSNFGNMPVSVTEVNATTSFKEAICRDALFHIYGQGISVNRTRPTWLKSPHSNKSLELDVYCEEKNVAVEFNGSQHYLFEGISKMDNRIQKDICKLRTSAMQGVELVVVPYQVSSKMIVKFILLRLSTSAYLTI